MPRPKPDKVHDDLDALLDGRPVELTEELGPLAEAAGALRAELDAFELDPEVADRHLERVLVDSGTVVPLPARPQPSGWELRRRIAAVVLAAALVLAPATMASAAALPGQAIYPLKLAIEQVRLAAVQWSSTREALERTRVADERLDELDRLVELRMFAQVPPAIRAVARAVVAAEKAVAEAAKEGAPIAAGLQQELKQVAGGMIAEAEEAKALARRLPVPAGIIDQIQTAAEQSTQVVPPPVRPSSPTPQSKSPTSTTAPTAATSPPPPVTDPTEPAPEPTATTASPPPPPPEPEPTTTEAPTTTVPPTTAPPPTEAETPPRVDTDSAGQSPSEGNGRSAEEGVPGTTAAGP